MSVKDEVFLIRSEPEAPIGKQGKPPGFLGTFMTGFSQEEKKFHHVIPIAEQLRGLRRVSITAGCGGVRGGR